MKFYQKWFNRMFRNQVIEGPDWQQQLADFLGIDLESKEINVSGKHSLNEIVVYVCIKILTDNISKLPAKVYRDSDGISKAADHYLYPLIKLRPNPYMSAADFWKCVEAQRNIHGNAYVWIDFSTVGRNSGQVRGLYPLDASNMQVWVDDEGLIGPQDRVWYIYSDTAGRQHKLQSTDLLHFKSLTTDGLVGISPVSALKNVIENGAAAEKFLNSSFKNGMLTKGIIHFVGDLDEGKKEKFRQKFEAMSSGLKNANRVSLLPVGYTYQPLSLTMTDAQFLENTQLTYRQIASAFGIKSHQINDLIKTSYASSNQAYREFYVDTLLPILTMYEQELSYKLFRDSELRRGYFIRFNVDSILRASLKERYDAYAIGIQNGFLKPNEARALENKPPDPFGDQLVMNGNVIPLSMVGQQYQRQGGDNDNA